MAHNLDSFVECMTENERREAIANWEQFSVNGEIGECLLREKVREYFLSKNIEINRAISMTQWMKDIAMEAYRFYALQYLKDHPAVASKGTTFVITGEDAVFVLQAVRAMTGDGLQEAYNRIHQQTGAKRVDSYTIKVESHFGSLIDACNESALLANAIQAGRIQVRMIEDTVDYESNQSGLTA